MYTIKILNNGDWFAPGTTIYDPGYGKKDPVKICMVFFLVQGDGRTILVDTGLDDLDKLYTEADQAQWDHLGPSRNTRELLEEAGTSCEEVDTVVITHLHFDHYCNIQQFPNARFIVPRKEWFHVMDPTNLPVCPAYGIPREPLSYLAGEAFERLILVEDGYQVYPGIRMHLVGGHSPGSMVVLIETKAGSAMVVGDAFFLYEQIENNIALGLYMDYQGVLKGYEWIRSQNAILLPAHDYEIFKRHPSLTIG